MSMRKLGFLHQHPRVLALCTLLVALVCFGQAVWIYAKAELAQILIESAWERTLAQPGSPHKPWRWADTWPVARLQWQGNGKAEDMYVLAGGTGNALAFGPGHLIETAPLGEGASVVAGHRDTHFAFLRDVQPGNEVALQNANGEWLVYTVADTKVSDSSLGPLLLDPTRDSLTLVTCYPFDALLAGGPLRYEVTALRQEF
jgi:sortase A